MKTTEFQVYVPMGEGLLVDPATGYGSSHNFGYRWLQIDWDEWHKIAEYAATCQDDNMEVYPHVW